jgi:hypothetical protein
MEPEPKHATMIIIHVDDITKEMSYLIANESIYLKEVPSPPLGTEKRKRRHPDEFIKLNEDYSVNYPNSYLYSVIQNFINYNAGALNIDHLKLIFNLIYNLNGKDSPIDNPKIKFLYILNYLKDRVEEKNKETINNFIAEYSSKEKNELEWNQSLYLNIFQPLKDDLFFKQQIDFNYINNNLLNYEFLNASKHILVCDYHLVKLPNDRFFIRYINNTPHKPNKMGFPKGGIEDAENSFQTGIREFNEEINFKFKDIPIEEINNLTHNNGEIDINLFYKLDAIEYGYYKTTSRTYPTTI